MSQIEKNTVDAKMQLGNGRYVRFVNPDGKGKRILFAGNSITLHGIKPEIGWHWEWGMAASCKKNDYVHLLMEQITQHDPDAAFCIAQVSQWEVSYRDCDEVLKSYQIVRDFQADVVIMRCVENCPWDNYTDEIFIKNYEALIDCLNPKNTAVILTTSFWPSLADGAIRQVGMERGYPVVYLGDLGEQDEMMAKGLFSHSGVAMHPNDNGMREIANRIQKELLVQLS